MVILRHWLESAFGPFHYSIMRSATECADPGGLIVNTLSVIGLGFEIRIKMAIGGIK